MVPYTKKYSPKKSSELVGQDNALEQIKSFIINFKNQKKKALLLHGPSGVGKTSVVYAIANELSLEVFELNASDFRNKEQILSKVGAAVYQKSLFAKGKIILIDDIDGLSGTKDRGAIPELVRFIQKTPYPMVLTISNPYDHKFSKIRSKATLIAFEPVENKKIVSYLGKIVKKEHLDIDDETLKAIARRSGGDLRAATNDLQILSAFGNITKDTLEQLGIREKQDTIIDALLKIFKTTDPKVANNAFQYVNEDLSTQILWIDENLPKEYEKPQDLARAYDALSKADIFQRRIRRWQHWRFLIYINALLTVGIAVAKDEKYTKFSQYKPTGRILKMWWAKQKNLKKKSIAEKLAFRSHTSIKRAMQMMPYLQTTVKNDKKYLNQISEELDLDKDQIDWLKK